MKSQKSKVKSQKFKAGCWIALLLLTFNFQLSTLFGQTPVLIRAPDRTYRAAYSVACGGAGDCATIYFASKTVRVRQVLVSKPSAGITVSLIVRSAVDTGGTAGTIPTAVSMDSGDAAATATLAVYTAAPTAGATVGSVGLLTMATTDTWVQSFGTLNSKALALQAAGQGLAINVSGAATITVNLEWTETP